MDSPCTISINSACHTSQTPVLRRRLAQVTGHEGQCRRGLTMLKSKKSAQKQVILQLILYILVFAAFSHPWPGLLVKIQMGRIQGPRDQESRTDDLWPKCLRRKNGTRVVRPSIILSNMYSPKMNHVTLRTCWRVFHREELTSAKQGAVHSRRIYMSSSRNNNNLGMSEVVVYHQLISVHQQ